MFDVIDDTIVAVSSPPGAGVRGIVRCSGPETLRLACCVFTPLGSVDIEKVPGFRRVHGWVAVEPGCAVPGEVYLFRGLRSYSRQDCVEYHVPGAPILLAMLVERLIGLGARAAEPGEFTARAFLSGAMDLPRAEAIAATIRSRSDAQLRVSRRMMDGRLTDVTGRIVEDFAELVALVEADIDFAEEPIDFISPAELKTRLADIARRLEHLSFESESSARVDALPRILLVGRSNAGKSTLMNRLSGMDRSICSQVPGTTRDILSAPVRLGGGEAVLLDAAGVDPDTDGLPREASAATLSAARGVDLICLVVDLAAAPGASACAPEGMPVEIPCVVVGNKIDALDERARAARVSSLERSRRGQVCSVSALTGEGIEACRGLLARTLELPETGIAADAVVVTARQRDAVETALAAVRRCAAEASDIDETIDRADILAFELREGLEALGAIAGTVTTEALLGRVFASFCIGK